MIEKHLGESIDIHGGGQDLIFPHHENEIAQSCCAHDGKPFANVWMHNGFINIEGEKMSKSLGNFRMVNDLLEQYPGEVLRYVILSAHYRSEQNFGKDLLDSAWRSLDTLYSFLRAQGDVTETDVDITDSDAYRALLDDLNTPVAISELHKLAREMNAAQGGARSEAKGRLLAVAELLGLLQQDAEQWFTLARGGSDISAEQIEMLIAKRNQAKADKDYAGADAVREELKAMGVVLEDSREGTQWRRE
jgi:cysteinyl-tRNA synthetase